MSETMNVSFTLNGAEVSVTTDPKRSALKVLREDLGHISLKPGCDPQGICGCCAALVEGKPRLTCTLPVKSLNGKSVTTQEGLSPLEAEAFAEAFVSCGGSQCGYCTAGFIMKSKVLLSENPSPTREQLKDELAGNLCRCAGFIKIYDAVERAAAELREKAPTQPAPVTAR